MLQTKILFLLMPLLLVSGCVQEGYHTDPATGQVESCIRIGEVSAAGSFMSDNLSLVNECNQTIVASNWYVSDGGDMMRDPYKLWFNATFAPYGEVFVLTGCGSSNDTVVYGCFENDPLFSGCSRGIPETCRKDWLALGGDCVSLFGSGDTVLDKHCWGSKLR